MENNQQQAQDLREYIQSIGELNAEQKEKYLVMLDGGESELVILDEIDKLLQNQLDQEFREAGVSMDENDPEYIAKQNEMEEEIENAGAEYEKAMGEVEKEAAEIQASLAQEMDVVSIKALKEKMM